MKTVFGVIALSVVLLTASCSSHSPRQQPKPTEQKSQFDGTTDALKKMRIPEVPSNQKFEGFQPKKPKEKEKPK